MQNLRKITKEEVIQADICQSGTARANEHRLTVSAY